jgi:hypothetical protein
MAGAARWLVIADKLAKVDQAAEQATRQAIELELLKINRAIDAAEAAQFGSVQSEAATRDDSPDAIG